MSFGGKLYEHRFFTAPKVRLQQIGDSISPEISRSRYQSAVCPPPHPHTHLQQSTVKQSYLRMMFNQRNSRILTKDSLGSQSLKFEKDVINRYCEDDYKQKADILQRFKLQAEELKRKRKYRHVSVVNQTEENISNNGNNFTVKNENRMKTYRGQGYSRVLQQNLNNQQSISLLPITNNKANVSRVSVLKQLKLPTISSYGFKDPVVEQDTQQNQHQFLGEDHLIRDSLFLSRVCDVGVTANLTTDKQIHDNYRRKTIQKPINYSNLITRRQPQFFNVQTLRSKNQHLKKKYERLRKQLSRKAKQVQKQKHISQFHEPNQQFEQKIQNLSLMIHTLCDKLRQKNCQMLVNSKSDENPNHEQQKTSYNINSEKINYNQTQINLSNPAVANQYDDEMTISKQTIIQSTYVPEIGGIDYFQKIRPRIVYTLNKHSKNVNFDPLRLLKNKINERTKHLPNKNDFTSRRRIKTQNQ